MDLNTGVINFEVYENGSNFIGMAKVTLPDAVYKTTTVNGAGLAGDVDVPMVGMFDSMSATFEFTDSVIGAHKLSSAGKHIIDLRTAHNHYDATKGIVSPEAHKYTLEVIAKSRNGGEVAPASNQTRTVECSVISFKEYIANQLVTYIDPVNFKYIDASGTDILAEVRTALGKSTTATTSATTSTRTTATSKK